MDFVVGIEIRLSGNHTIENAKGQAIRLTDICDELAGKYPKDFKFVGWHPHCRCQAISILKTEKEMEEDTQRILDGKTPAKGSVNAVEGVPAAFSNWVETHSDRIVQGGSLPYFLRDNKGIVDEILGMRNGKKTPLEIAAERHAKRTAADVERIQTAWNQRLLNNLASQTERIGSFRDKEMLEWIQILQDEVDIKRFDFFSKDYATAKAYLEKRIFKETEAAKAFMATKANAENMKALAKALGVEQGELMTFFEADMHRGNPNFAVAEMYRVNCQTCVVANELRRRGFNIQALGNFKGSKSEELSKFTNGIWQKADGNIPSKIRIGAEYNKSSYTDPSGKFHKRGFSKTVPNRKRLVSELEANLSEDGRYHIDWTWKGSGKERSGHIITVEKIGDTVRYYDPQTGKIISDFTEYIKEIDLSRGINLLRVDNLQIKPNYAADILTKSGAKTSTGTSSASGITGRIKSQVSKQAKQDALEWVETLTPIPQPNGTISYQETVGHITIPGKTFINETYAKNIHNKELAEIMEAATHAKEWIPKATLVKENEPGIHHPYPFNVYEVEWQGRLIQFKTKCLSGETLYTMRFIKKKN